MGDFLSLVPSTPPVVLIKWWSDLLFLMMFIMMFHRIVILISLAACSLASIGLFNKESNQIFPTNYRVVRDREQYLILIELIINFHSLYFSSQVVQTFQIDWVENFSCEFKRKGIYRKFKSIELLKFKFLLIFLFLEVFNVYIYCKMKEVPLSAF